VKLFRSEEDVVVRLLVDASASLDWGDPRKFDVARRLAAAFGYIALAAGQRVEVVIAQRAAGATKSALGRVGMPRRGRAGLAALLRELSRASAEGRCDLSRGVDQIAQRSARPGLIVVISDFLDDGPVTTAFSRARAAGHDLCLVHVVARSELEPTFEGDLSLVDAETGRTVEVTMDPNSIEAYVLRFTGLVEELRSFARRHGASYVRAISDEPLDAAVRRLVAREID